MKRIVIDCDPGIDDAQAIMMAYLHPDVKIEAITTVAGNVGIHNTSANALKVLDVLQADDIPVFAGAATALVHQAEDAAYVHGKDGLGDCGFPVSKRKLQEGHAALALVRLANENPGELELIAIGPLTNLALAIRLDPDLPKKYKKLVIMGGTIYGQGNTINIAAEFNIFADPEAASIVFENWNDLSMISWEATLAHGIDLERFKSFLNYDTDRSRFLKEATVKLLVFLVEGLNRDMSYAADPLAMAVLLEPDIVKKSEHLHVHVECGGGATRGMTVLDWWGMTQKAPNTHVILEVDQERFLDLLESIVR